MAPTKKKVESRVLLGRTSGNLRMGLVGLPNVGKSTTFNLLSKQAVPAENYPFCTIDPHEARINVPDERFKWLCENFKPASEVSANLTIYDIAGLVPGAHKGEGLGNAFLSHIQSVDGIYHVVRIFEDDEIIHTEGNVNPINDLKTINDELRLKDISKCEKLINEKNNKRMITKTDKEELDLLNNILNLLNNNEWIINKNWKSNEIEYLNTYQLLTAKPIVYLLNMSIKDYIRQKNKWLTKIALWIKENNNGPIIPYSAAFEMNLTNFNTIEEKENYMKQIGVQKSMIDKIVTIGYNALNLIHFFTCGADEVRCWTIRQGTKAPQAAGQIHSDMEKGFICADVYKYEDLVEYKTESALKAHGKLYQKGKDYIVEDGDCVFFKFNPSSKK